MKDLRANLHQFEWYGVSAAEMCKNHSTVKKKCIYLKSFASKGRQIRLIEEIYPASFTPRRPSKFRQTTKAGKIVLWKMILFPRCSTFKFQDFLLALFKEESLSKLPTYNFLSTIHLWNGSGKLTERKECQENNDC